MVDLLDGRTGIAGLPRTANLYCRTPARRSFRAAILIRLTCSPRAFGGSALVGRSSRVVGLLGLTRAIDHALVWTGRRCAGQLRPGVCQLLPGCEVGERAGDCGGAARYLQPGVDVLQVDAHGSL